MITLGAHLGIGVWLVVASRLLTGTGVSASGMLDDLALVLLLGALQCALVRRARGVALQLLALLPITLAAAYFLANQAHYAFFKTNLGIAAFQIGTMAIDARTSVGELLGFANVTTLLVVPVVLQLVLLRIGGARMPAAAAPLVLSGLLAAGVAGLFRHEVFIFPDHNPAMSLAREAATRTREATFGRPRLELERSAASLFNREGYVGYEFAGTPERPLYQRPSVIFVAKLGLFAVAFGSGDRDDLWLRTRQDGRFYLFVDDTDRLVPASLPLTEADFQRVNLGDPNLNADLLLSRPQGQKGWYLAFGSDERVITESFSLLGVTIFSSYLPHVLITRSACDPSAPGCPSAPAVLGSCAS